MNKFVEFIKGNPKPEFYEFAFSERFRDASGKPIIFKIKGDLPLEVQEGLERSCQIKDKQGNVIGLNKTKFALKMLAEWTLEPNFKNAEDLAALGLHTPDEYINKMFTSGEQLAFMTKINELTGVGQSIAEEIEEAKN